MPNTAQKFSLPTASPTLEEQPKASTTPNSVRPQLLSTVLGLSLGIVVFSIISGKIALWTLDGPVLAGSMRYPLAFGLLGLLLCSAALALRRARFEPLSFGLGMSLCLSLFFCFDWINRSYSLLLGPSIRGEIILGAILFALLLKTCSLKTLCIALFPASLLALMYSFVSTFQGKLILGDDHSVFLHRLSLLKENFPAIPVFDTSWNAGLDSLHLFATGVMNVFFLQAPFIYALPLEKSYSVVVGMSIFALVPVCSYLAARTLRCSIPCACLSAVLSMTQSLFFYRWGLVYGTMGFITSCALLPYVFAQFCKFWDEPAQFGSPAALLLFLSCSLMLCWPLSAIPCIIIPLYVLVAPRQFFANKRFIISCLCVLLVTLPWVYVLWSGWNVKSFIAAKKVGSHQVEASIEESQKSEFRGTVFRAHEREVSISEAVKIIRDKASVTNPLLLLLALPGMLLLGGRKRQIFLLTTAALILIACIGGPLRPQLELERMLLMLTCLCAMPAALAIEQLWLHRKQARVFELASLLLAGFFFAGVVSTAGLLANRRSEQIHVAKTSFFQMAEIIQKHGGAGRTMFSGFVLHELNEGHLAPLSHFTDKPMLASSHVHNVWQYTDIIPEEYRAQGEFGIETYLDLFNTSFVIAHEPVWRAYFRNNKERYTEVADINRFVFFRREPFPDTYFLEGRGEILQQSTSGLKLRLDTRDAILRFRYNPNIVVEGCKSLNPHPMNDKLEFISLHNCSLDEVISISGRSFSQRVLLGIEKATGPLRGLF